MFSNERIKVAIKKFYEKEYKHFDCLGVTKLLYSENKIDIGCRYIMWKLENELAMKDRYELVNKEEKTLLLALSKDSETQLDKECLYSDELVGEFANVLKEKVLQSK